MSFVRCDARMTQALSPSYSSLAGTSDEIPWNTDLVCVFEIEFLSDSRSFESWKRFTLPTLQLVFLKKKRNKILVLAKLINDPVYELDFFLQGMQLVKFWIFNLLLQVDLKKSQLVYLRRFGIDTVNIFLRQKLACFISYLFVWSSKRNCIEQLLF